MSKLNLIYQGQREEINHIDALQEMIEKDTAIEQIIISSAFVRSEGVNLIKNIINDNLKHTSIYMGIRNGITSIQSIFLLLKHGVTVYVVDTASPAILYHPKIFGVKSKTKISFLIGSANLTSGGLYRNIEASFHYVDEISEESNHLWNQYEESLRYLREDCSENVLKISNYRECYKLFMDGLLTDERISIKPKIDGVSKSKNKSIKKSISLNTKKITTKKNVTKKKRKIISNELENNNWVLLWEINSLTKRDLNIPTGDNTHSTGDMNFKKGALENIDQRHYFRDEIFNNLEWVTDNRKPHLERAEADFQIIVNGVNYGVFDLRITHNTNKESTSYKQNNCMTKLSWGSEAKKIISNEELLNSSLKMYKPKDKNSYFILEFL